MILAYDVSNASPSNFADEIACLVRMYGNQIKMLDYSELDTLTRLLNRNTIS